MRLKLVGIGAVGVGNVDGTLVGAVDHENREIVSNPVTIDHLPEVVVFGKMVGGDEVGSGTGRNRSTDSK